MGAMKSGDMELAWRIALAGLKLAWFDTVEWMKAQLFNLTKGPGEVDKKNLAGKIAGTLLFGIPGFFLGPRIEKGLKREVGAAVGGGPDMAKRAQLLKDLNAALAEVKPEVPEVLQGRLLEAKGAFQSPDFARALGFGSTVGSSALDVAKDAVLEAKKEVALLEEIRDKVGMEFA
jgi:hypothetical protein